MSDIRNLDKEAVIRLMQELLGKFGPAKFRVYRHAIYNGQGLIVPVDKPFPQDLDASEWAFLLSSPTTRAAAVKDIAAQGYHLFQNDDLAAALDVPALSKQSH